MRKTTVGVPWFDLARHEDPDPVDPPVEPPVTDPAGDPPTDPPAAPPADAPVDPPSDTDDDQAAELAKWKAMARKHETNAKAKEREAKANAAAAKELAALKAAQLSEAEKVAAAKDAAEKRAAAAVERAVRAEVRALAADDFADPSDAVDAIRAAEYVDADGEIDLDAIKAKLADLLEAKPHWKKPDPAPKPVATPPKPKPDPSQGARPPAAPKDFKTAPREEVLAELAKHGVRLR